MTLYEIKEQFLTVLNGLSIDEDTGELIGADALDAIESEFQDKAVAIGCYIKELCAEAAAIKAEETELEKRRKSRENKAEKLKAYLAETMQTLGKEFVEDPKLRISFRPSAAVEATDETLIPAEYWKETVTRKMDKKKISDAINAGISVPGAEIVKRQNLQIK